MQKLCSTSLVGRKSKNVLNSLFTRFLTIPIFISRQLSFEKGEKILLQKKIDQIWYKGQIHNRAGLFPINHVQVVIPLPHPQCKALYDFRMGPNEKEGCLEFRKGAIIDVIRRVDQNWVEGKIAEKVGIFPLSFVELNPEGHKLVNEGEVRAVPATVVSSSAKSPVQQAPRTSPPQQINPVGPKPASNEHQNKVGVIHPEDPRYQGRFVAIYPYKPQKKDELELKKGGHYYISEKCQDGWCKGYSADNPFIHGMFPGNYLMPVIMFQLMMARRAMVLHSQSQNQQSPQNQSQQTSNACYTNPIVMTNPPELPPRNSVRVAPKPSGPVDQKKEESKVHPKKESMGDMFRKQWSKYNKRSHATESGEDCVDGSFSMDNPVFEDLPSPQHQQQPQKLINKNLIEARPIHMRSGSCPSQLLHNEMEEKKNLPPK
jgi:E3 ubiquitin-protein ligase SH3RF